MTPIPAVAGQQLVVKCPVAGYPIESIIWEKGKYQCLSLTCARLPNSQYHIRFEVFTAVTMKN
jgi:hypothetical protein